MIELLMTVPPAPDALLWPYEPGTSVVIEAPRNAWGIRHVAREITERMQLSIIYKFGAECIPELECITVLEEPIEDNYIGAFYPAADTIVFNTEYNYIGYKQQVACHELLHAIGFDHHRNRGCVGEGGKKFPSRLEYSVLMEHYNG